MNDSDLLRQYVQGSQTALAELLKRHLNLVYGAALRQVRDPGLAEDVTQQVFIALARKAPRLLGHNVLAAWLFNVTRFTALDALKMRVRRQRHEREAAEMAAQKPPASPETSDWTNIEPVLDHAMSRLSGADRTILLLRYWQDQTTAQLAAILGISDDTARKRLSRATDRLRKLLTRDGATVSAASLGPLLSSNVLAQAPAHLAAKVLAGASGKALATGSAAAAKGTGVVMAALKAKSVAAALIAFAALGGAVYVGKKIIMPDDAVITQTLPPAGGPVTSIPQVPTDPNWQSRFNSLYSLAPGQVLKHIPPPYIPERATYFNTHEKAVFSEDYSTDMSFTFSWDGSLHRLYWSTAQGTAGTALTEGLGLRAYQIEGPVDLWKLNLPGDLICLKSATADDKMNAFATVLSTRLGRPIHFQKAHAVRSAIVLSGTYVSPKNPEGKDATIKITPAPVYNTIRGGGGTYGNIDTFCDGLEVQTRMQVVNQINGHFRGAVIFTIALTPPDISHHPDQLQSLLTNLAQQTGLQYTIEPRETDLWTWTEG